MAINCYEAFINALLNAGFSMGSENDEGIFTLSSDFTGEVAWHTGQRDTDPWEWRMRVLEEREDIAYSKLFFKKSGYITNTWYPYFLSARRKGYHLEEAFSAGLIGQMEKQIYDLIQKSDLLPVHDIKRHLGITKESAGAFDKALVELQMCMYVTTCGRRQKTNRVGENFGWSSTVFCTTEHYFGENFVNEALTIDPLKAEEKITQQLAQLNPNYNPKKLKKFIYG